MKVGVIGIGRMGAALTTRLLALGHEATVWNRTPDKTRPLVAAGATSSATPAGVAKRSDAVISILSDAQAIAAAYEGLQGLLSGEAAGKLFIEMSTVRPGVQRALAEQVRKAGAAFVECPVGGTVGPAREGKLLGFVGGEAADVARARPLLEQLCRRVEHVGPVGAGASVKLAINLPLLVYWQALGEALALCGPLGIDPARLMDIFVDTSGGTNALKVRAPAIAAAMQGQAPGPVASDVELARKDLATMIEEAAALGVALPVSARALECYEQAAREGRGGVDMALVPVELFRKTRAAPGR
jgi:3-hydroxyisobutyrate dehydrogenase